MFGDSNVLVPLIHAACANPSSLYARRSYNVLAPQPPRSTLLFSFALIAYIVSAAGVTPTIHSVCSCARNHPPTLMTPHWCWQMSASFRDSTNKENAKLFDGTDKAPLAYVFLCTFVYRFLLLAKYSDTHFSDSGTSHDNVLVYIFLVSHFLCKINVFFADAAFLVVLLPAKCFHPHTCFRFRALSDTPSSDTGPSHDHDSGPFHDHTFVRFRALSCATS